MDLLQKLNEGIHEATSSFLPPEVGNILNPVTNAVQDLLKVKIGNINLDFSKVKFPSSPEGWKELGERIKKQLEEVGQSITIDDAIALAQKMAQAAKQAQGAQAPATSTPSASVPNAPSRVPTTIPSGIKTGAEEENNFIERAVNDKRYWLGAGALLLLLMRK